MAMIDGNIITTFINKFFSDLSDAVVNKAISYNELLLQGVSAFIAAAFMLYLVWRCVEFITDDNPPPVTIVFREILILSLLGAFTFGGSLYTSTVATMIMDAGDDLAEIVTGQKAITSIITMVGGFITSLFGMIEKSSGISLLDMSVTLVCSIIALFVGVYILLKFFIECLGLLILVKFMSGILVAVGGIFICAGYFKPTRRMFHNWCNLSLNYVLTNVVLCIALALLIGVLESAVSDIKLTSLIIMICCLKVGGMIVGSIPSVVTALSSVGGSLKPEQSNLGIANYTKGVMKGFGGLFSKSNKVGKA